MNLIEIKNLSKSYSFYSGLLTKSKQHISAVKNIDLKLKSGSIYGLIGPSGCGKSTLSRLICGLEKADKGRVLINSKDINKTNKQKRSKLIQVVQQFHTEAFDPLYTFRRSFKEISSLHEDCQDLDKLLAELKLSSKFLNSYPHQLSGGQLARMNLARALLVKPSCLILDEVTSSLDVSIQAGILKLLKNIKKKHPDIIMLIIAHDLRVVSSIADRIIVMEEGRLVEKGTAKKILERPQEKITKTLVGCLNP